MPDRVEANVAVARGWEFGFGEGDFGAAMAQGDRLEFRNVTMRFEGRGRGTEPITAVENINFAIRDGEVVSLIGPSGCGKSTLLNIGSGLSRPTEGTAFVDAEEVVGPNAHVAFMLQKDLLLPWRTILENVTFGVEIQGMAAKERVETARRLLARFHLEDFFDHYPHQLSGGMRQRAALARTLAVDPTVLLLDEPFSALDAQTKMILQADLAATLAEAGKTALFITHDLTEAVALSDRVLVMSRRPGHIVEEISIELADRDKPLIRRQNANFGGYITRLLTLLDIVPDRLEDA